MARVSTLENAHMFAPFVETKMRMRTYVVNAGAAQIALSAETPPVVICDPGGGAIDLLLPAESEGLIFWIVNTADAAEAITVKEDSDTTTVISVAQNEAALVVCDGTNWHALQGATA